MLGAFSDWLLSYNCEPIRDLEISKKFIKKCAHFFCIRLYSWLLPSEQFTLAKHKHTCSERQFFLISFFLNSTVRSAKIPMFVHYIKSYNDVSIKITYLHIYLLCIKELDTHYSLKLILFKRKNTDRGFLNLGYFI